ncbi:uncharacterized protein GVI51_L07557 [Nakaseomyces glabratus]|uniref:DNA polymerase n=1 Tax=Candida glabrata (strain ATCC 2001 / BCRC 20586 / JCM 3761 / NBRC 0622 / NRRL Y-65 / CBS 138) TaxID=284593 RepID=Q6FKY2_CANGA|nr:uncharacterized protein CAGL0L07700g [Nakaseomyces glabratus]KAH7595593.1 DNA polymerase beta thumb [Nakaseomyces glabratus]KAH7602025.1 DNA polymerase beta thumb [Nakaseomyces glabratus]QHS68782.1 uncharacterized protein GVI51_L07557 [Nakaseomyces glabratus]CAG62082.1 unnamed protein product [Nakaseomyces glabratus]|eukprot:XP_449112.1 uncharacterized protein CAGL0L07700g [[Candida] glabrata]
MGILSGKKFLILPNSHTASVNILAGIVKEQGGFLVSSADRLSNDVVVLVNDSFVDKTNKIVNRGLFLKEFELDASVVWTYVLENELVCLRVSLVPSWVENGTFHFSDSERIILLDSESQERDTKNVQFHSAGNEEAGSDDETDVEGNKESTGDMTDVSDTATPQLQSSPLSKYIKQEEDIDNQVLINALGRLVKKYEVKGDQYRSRSYRLAKQAVEKYPHKITSGSQAQRQLSNIGSSIAKKIQLLLDTGTLPGLEDPATDEYESSLGYFSECYGIGVPMAKKWITLNISTFYRAVRLHPKLFISDWPILYGWTYYEDWSKRIPRDEVTAHFELVKEEVRRVGNGCSVEMQGSYVRGARDTGDVDLMFYKENCDDLEEVTIGMENVAASLYQKGYIKCFLLLTDKLERMFRPDILSRLQKCGIAEISNEHTFRNSDRGKKLFFGVELPGDYPIYPFDDKDILQLKPQDKFMSKSKDADHFCRRLDFFCCKWSELGAARIHYTGNTDYNRWLRVRAMDMGYKLTQHGIFKDDVLLESFDERKIFEYLHVPYLNPVDRNKTDWVNIPIPK